MTLDRGTSSFDLELMTPRLARKESFKRLIDRAEITASKKVAQLDFLVMAQAAEDGARRGDPDPVATLAEILGERRDEAEADAESVDLIVARGPARACDGRNQAELLVQARAYLAERQVMRGAVLLDFPHWHGLDQGKIVPLACAPAQHRRDLMVVQPLQRDHVDLDLQARFGGGADSAEHLIEIAQPGDVPEEAGIATVEAHVHAPDARIEQHSRMTRELRAVGRQGQIVETATDATAELLNQNLDALADQRLTAGESNPIHAAGNEDVGEIDDLFESQHVLFRQKAHLLGHAVAASKVAAVGDRYAHVSNPPAEAVDHWRARAHALIHTLSCAKL